MAESLHIPRREASEVEGGYHALRAEAIRLIQELSGDLWTDYNPHDPGLTILEQLCFALTELSYRTGFDVADHLADTTGTVPTDRLGLYPPHIVFPCRATTVDDYRTLLFDAVPELDNVWLETVEDGDVRGLYRIHAQIVDRNHGAIDRPREAPGYADPPPEATSVRARIEAVYRERRNLCEDLAAVCIVGRTPYELRGNIEIEEEERPIDVLARLYVGAAQLIDRSLPYRPAGELATDPRPPDEIFDGPLTKHISVEHADLERSRRGSLTLTEVADALTRIPGVARVERLELRSEDGQTVETIHYQPFAGTTPKLLLPGPGVDIGVEVGRGGRAHAVTVAELAPAMARRFARFDALRTAGRTVESQASPLHGKHRDLGSYYSIQHDFPDVYGINTFGLPAGVSARRAAQAANLKGYLLLFEQVMADFLSNLDQVDRLFSLDEDLDNTYNHRLLTDDDIPGIETVNADALNGDRHLLADELRDHDDVTDRRSRVLDYLLALQGQELDADSLYGRDFYGDRPIGQILIDAKLELLTLLCQGH